jgi:hypothetical protein
MGKSERAREAFRDVWRRYADVPEGHPAEKWRRWAHEELQRLEE